MDIIKVLDKEVLDYWNVKDMEDLSDRFELNGEVYFEKGEIDDGYDFYLGPSIDNGLSDSISMDKYIEKICKDYCDNRGVGMIKDRISRFPEYSTNGYPSTYVINDLFHQGGVHKNLFDYSLLEAALSKSGFLNTIKIDEDTFLDKFPEFPRRNDDFQSLYITSFKQF